MSNTVVETPAVRAKADLWHRWIGLWSGDFPDSEKFAVGDTIIAPNLVCHLAAYEMPESHTINSPGAVVRWIDVWHSYFSESKMITTVGPFVSDEHVIGRWSFRGVWQGGKPRGATAPAGTEVFIEGHDILRLDENGLIAEYWVGDNLLDMYGQVAAVRKPQAS
ncbi:hypothetical protein [Streptomyces sp. NPDC050564]|jgi:hypothetical protein|uniref:hypothetical protein n=1 Tax=Streptomyces sp. NPDC050564 TaxID=3365631 RepID=UPI0037998A0A